MLEKHNQTNNTNKQPYIICDYLFTFDLLRNNNSATSHCMKKMRVMYAIIYRIYLVFVGIIMVGVWFFVLPYLIASRSLTGIGFLIYGAIDYATIVLLTIEMVVGIFGETYDTKRKTILFSPTFKDGTPKPEGEEASPRLKILIIALSYLFIIYTYAITYLFVGNYIPGSFDKSSVVLIDAFFLSFTSITVGPSGIEPNSILTKILVMTEILWGIIYAIFIFSTIVFIINKRKKD